VTAMVHRWTRSALAVALLPVALGATGLHLVLPSPVRSLTVSQGSRTTTTRPSSSPRITPALPAFLAQSITFTSNKDAWLLGAARCATRWCTTVRHSTDRGGKWAMVTAPIASIGSKTTTQISELRFANQADGFAFNPGLWVTHDASAHWHRVNLHGAVLALATSTTEAYAAVAPCWPFTSTTCSSPSRLYRSPVGSDAWYEVRGVALPQSASPTVLDVRGSAVYLLLASQNYFIGARDGLHFVKFGEPCPSSHTGPGYGPADLAVSSAMDLAILCGGGVAAGSESKKAYVSTDDGRTFHQIATPPFSGDVGELAAASPTTLLMTAQSGASFVYRTSGTDSRWTTPLEIGDGGMGFYDLDFTDAVHGAVIHGPAALLFLSAGQINLLPDPGELYITNDGGNSWHQVVLGGH